MAMGSDHEQEVADVPHLTVNVSMLGGHACSISLPSTSTVSNLKSKLKVALGIPKRQQVVLVGGEMAPISRALQDVFGTESGPVHATVVRTTAFLRCGYCSVRDGLKRCSGCHVLYCGRACQKADWPRHQQAESCDRRRWMSCPTGPCMAPQEEPEPPPYLSLDE